LDIVHKAARARNLLADDTFKSVMEELKADQLSIFENSASADVNSREEAHSILSALKKIEFRLQAYITEEKILDKRK